MPVLRNEGIKYDRDPDSCPVCHRHVQPLYKMVVVTGPDSVQLVYTCPSQDCREVFIATYSRRGVTRPYELRELSPERPSPVPWGEIVEELSPQFVTIYTQARAAESYRLDQIAGMGYRKALEFLVNDYAIKRSPESADSIRKAFLGIVIADHIDDPNVRQVAKRATWLGNDEAHYDRRWDKDISDLKTLIQLTVNAIENVLLAKKYEDEMPDGGRKDGQRA